MNSITLGVQSGDEISSEAVRPHFLELRRLLREQCAGSYCNVISEFALVLRIDGKIWHWDFEGRRGMRLNRKNRYITVDIGLPRSRWENRNPLEIRDYLASQTIAALEEMIQKLQKAKIEVDAEKLTRDVKRTRDLFLNRAENGL